MNMPVVPPRQITRCQAITDIIESVAQEQAALGRILEAESDKLTRIASHVCACPKDLLKANRSAARMIASVSRLEIILQSKLELFEDCLCTGAPCPMCAEAE